MLELRIVHYGCVIEWLRNCETFRTANTLPARERLALISKADKLSGCIGACERIHQTAVPLNYARHSLRALTLWLFTLPFALVGSLKLITGPALFLVSWLLFGVYEIGYSIEDPFQGTLRLSVLCDTIRRDVLADEVIRSTAFEKEDARDDTTQQPKSAKKDKSSDGVPSAEEQAAYALSHVGKTDANGKKMPVQEQGDDDDDDDDYEDDYESSSVNRDTTSSKPKNKTTRSSKSEDKTSNPVEVEELPSIPIIRNLDSSDIYPIKSHRVAPG